MEKDFDTVSCIDSITEDEWKNMTMSVADALRKKKFGGDPMKIAVHCFLEWLINNDYTLAIEVETPPPTDTKH